MDQRWKRLADILVDHSTEVRSGERVMIAMGEISTYPLVQAVYEACVKAGAFPQVQFLSETLKHALLRHGNCEQIDWVPEIEAHGMDWADVYFGLRGAHNLFEHADIPSEVLARHQRAMGKVSTLRWQETRWCLIRVPNSAFAQQAETDLETITDMFFNSCLLDWPVESLRWHRLAEQLRGGSLVHIQGVGTDLQFSVEGRDWRVLDGRINMPDGEILTAPINDSLNGTICFEFPGIFGGRLIPDIVLSWRDGELVEARASQNEDYLHQILETDPGASRLGEFAFGLNPHVTHFCKDILIDEKMGGTVHIALGRAYPECGGTNESAIHWDIVKDLRMNGTVSLDGKTIFARGRFTEHNEGELDGEG